MSPQVLARAQDRPNGWCWQGQLRSTVYRANYLDYVSVKKINEAGCDRESSSSVCTRTRRAPRHRERAVLRRKLAQVLAAAG